MTLPLLLLAVSPALAIADQQEATLSFRVAQARFFIKKGWYADARQELESALETEAGAHSQEVHWLLAQVCFELLDAAAAREHAEKAAELVALGGDEEVARQAREMADFLAANFGQLRVEAPQPGVRSRLQVEAERSFLDPELKRFYNRQALALREKTELPVTFSLPAGRYRVNGSEVEVPAGGEASLTLPLSALGDRGLAALQVTRLEVSTGFGVLFGQEVENLMPALDLQLALTQPVGRGFVGLTLDRELRSYEVEGWGTHSDARGGGVGLRAGMEIFLSGPFALRPALGYRYALLPGVAASCREQDGGLSCSGSVPGDVRLYGVATAHVPYAEVDLDYREGGRTNALGLGFRLAVDELIGSLPAESQARWAEELGEADEELQVTTEDVHFAATGFRLLTNLSIAF